MTFPSDWSKYHILANGEKFTYAQIKYIIFGVQISGAIEGRLPVSSTTNE
jgi:hypothetical protein